jgi:tetratricopeptide (TPR) repeat protein
MDSKTAVQEAIRAAELWPTSAALHAMLAQAYDTAANSARFGNYYADMTPQIRKTWEKNITEAFLEAQLSANLDKNCSQAWEILLSSARELGADDTRDKAYTELVRIDPKNWWNYEIYAFSFSPQWNGSQRKQEMIISDAEKVLGKNSADAYLLRAWVSSSNDDRAEHREENLLLVNKAIRKYKKPNINTLSLKCSILTGLKRRAEVLATAEKGYRLCPSPEWQMQLAKGYQFRWEDQRDLQALNRAEELTAKYVKEIPFDPFGHIEHGWCLSHQGNPAAAKKEFLRALELDPANKVAREKLQYVQ